MTPKSARVEPVAHLAVPESRSTRVFAPVEWMLMHDKLEARRHNKARTEHLRGDGVNTLEQDPIITPSMELVVSVRHTAPASTPPDELLAFVVPVYDEDQLIDWTLTTDAVAFGNVDTPQMFDRWRSTWERSWTLDPLSSLERLVGVAQDLRTVVGDIVPDALGFVLERVRRGERVRMEASAMPALAAALESLRDAIRERGHTAFGFVNATPGYEGTGLGRAWSPCAGPEVLAADHSLEVSIHPVIGLVVRSRLDDNRYSGVRQVEMFHDRVECEFVDDRALPRIVSFDSNQATPLAWTMPNATKWRVVEVPEVLTWARSISGLIECCALASTLDEPAHFASSAERLSGSTHIG